MLHFQMSPIRWFALHHLQSIKQPSFRSCGCCPASISFKKRKTATVPNLPNKATICNDMQRYATICKDTITCYNMVAHVVTMKGPLQVLLVREVNAIGRHIRCAFSNCGAQKQGKGVKSGRHSARDVFNNSECLVFACP